MAGSAGSDEHLPSRTSARAARLARLPLGMAGRAVGGWGKKMAGRDAGEVNADLQAKAAEQLFEVLGTLKGGAMKFGQALSVFEAAVPEAYAAPYREALTKLQAAAPPMPIRQTHRVLDEQLGTAWRKRFAEFDEVPAASASIGQVHKAQWHDGRLVAVKVQYPGADEALRSDLRQLMRFARLFQTLAPGLEVRELLAELADRMTEELDYRIEADYQRGFAKAFDGDPHFVIPKVVASSPKVTVTEWVDGTPLARLIAGGDQDHRNLAAKLLAEFHYSAPARAGLMHADPHPGNFMLTSDDRLVVIDFGATARLEHGIPRGLGELTRLARDGDKAELIAALRKHRFLLPGQEVAADDVLAYLAPLFEPLTTETFHFSREWLQGISARMADIRGQEFRTARALNLPAEYLLIQRTMAGSTAILCQLDAVVGVKAIAERWVPGLR